MDENTPVDPLEYRPGLNKIRRRRWFLWLTIIVYVPAMMISLNAPEAGKTVVTVFIIWILILCVAVALAALVRCPRCGECFHTNGPTFLPFRRCLHCSLHVSADRKKTSANE